MVDGTAVTADLRDEGGMWAAQARVGDVVATVVGRGIAFEAVRLESVRELGPYLVARDAELERITADYSWTPPEQLDLPPAHGLEAHQALIRASVAEGEDIRAQVVAGRRPRRFSRARGEEFTRSWERATRAQMHLAGQPRAEANTAVTAMVNQAISLSEKASWFANRRLRDQAIEEMLRFTAFDSDVPSRSAQQLWQRGWAARFDVPEHTDQVAMRTWSHTHDELEGDWLAAWQQWADRR